MHREVHVRFLGGAIPLPECLFETPLKFSSENFKGLSNKNVRFCLRLKSIKSLRRVRDHRDAGFSQSRVFVENAGVSTFSKKKSSNKVTK